MAQKLEMHDRLDDLRGRCVSPERVRRQEIASFTYYAPEAHEILNDLLEKYGNDGDDLEIQREGEAQLSGKKFKPAIERPYRRDGRLGFGRWRNFDQLNKLVRG